MKPLTQCHGQLQSLKFKSPFVTAIGTFEHREVLLIALVCEGVSGYGEAAPLPGFSEESMVDVQQQFEQIQPKLVQMAMPQSVDKVQGWLMRMSASTLYPSLRFALEVAALDYCARLNNLSLVRLLSGERRGVPVNCVVSGAGKAACFVGATHKFDEGYRTFKIKVGAQSLSVDVERVKAVRDAVGDAARIRLDANGAWHVHQAIECIDALADFDIDFIEQPIPANEIAGMAQVRAATTVKIAVDEGVRDMQSLKAYLDADAAEVIVLKPSLIGSLFESKKMIELAQSMGHKVIVTTALDGAIGRSALVHFCAALALEEPCGLATGALFDSDASSIYPELDHIEHGILWPLDDVGHGITPMFKTNVNHPEKPVSVPIPLQQRAAFMPSNIALVVDDTSWTYAELWQEVVSCASALFEDGVRPGDRVAVWSDNDLELIVVIHALMSMGAVVVPCHPDWASMYVVQQVLHAHCSMLLVDDQRALLPFDSDVMVRRLNRRSTPNFDLILDSVYLSQQAAILFTSGTTGTPKMVPLTWGNLIFSATGSAIQLGHLPTDRWLCVLPICHIAGLSIVFRCAVLGTTVVLHPVFEPQRVANSMVSGEVTLVSLVSRMFKQVLSHMDSPPHADFRTVLLGGGAIDDALLKQSCIQHVPVSTTYGMTEAASQLTTCPPSINPLGQGAGLPLIWTQVRLVEHQIEAKSPTCSAGYLVSDADSVSLSPESPWRKTGDWGQWMKTDAGQRLEILDRRTDLIVTGGENVSPHRVEAYLRTHPSVQDACVVGLPSSQWGAQVEAVVVLKNNKENLNSLMMWCKQGLALFEVPKMIHIWPSLPTTTLEKISRAAVRRRLLGEDHDH